MAPLRVLCDLTMNLSNEEEKRKLKEGLDSWNEGTFKRMCFKEDMKVSLHLSNTKVILIEFILVFFRRK